MPNLVIPLWAIVAYLILVLSPGWRAHPPAAIAHQTPKGIQITTILSLALLIAVILGIGWYVYDSASGVGYLVGEAIGVGLVAFLVAAAVARSSKKPIRLDIAFGLVACFLLLQHGREILETNDVHRLQSELRSVVPADREKALATSATQMAALIRDASSIGQEANAKISAIFAELDDPLLDNALTTESLSNLDTITRAEKTANQKVALARTALQRIDAVMADELQQDQKLTSGLSESTAADFIKGVERRHARHRALYQRRADLMVETIEELTATLAFVSSRAGTYRIENGKINFQSTEDADGYVAHVAKIQALASQEDQLNKEVREEQENSARMTKELFNANP